MRKCLAAQNDQAEKAKVNKLLTRIRAYAGVVRQRDRPGRLGLIKDTLGRDGLPSPMTNDEYYNQHKDLLAIPACLNNRELMKALYDVNLSSTPAQQTQTWTQKAQALRQLPKGAPQRAALIAAMKAEQAANGVKAVEDIVKRLCAAGQDPGYPAVVPYITEQTPSIDGVANDKHGRLIVALKDTTRQGNWYWVQYAVNARPNPDDVARRKNSPLRPTIARRQTSVVVQTAGGEAHVFDWTRKTAAIGGGGKWDTQPLNDNYEYTPQARDSTHAYNSVRCYQCHASGFLSVHPLGVNDQFFANVELNGTHDEQGQAADLLAKPPRRNPIAPDPPETAGPTPAWLVPLNETWDDSVDLVNGPGKVAHMKHAPQIVPKADGSVINSVKGTALEDFPNFFASSSASCPMNCVGCHASRGRPILDAYDGNEGWRPLIEKYVRGGLMPIPARPDLRVVVAHDQQTRKLPDTYQIPVATDLQKQLEAEATCFRQQNTSNILLKWLSLPATVKPTIQEIQDNYINQTEFDALVNAGATARTGKTGAGTRFVIVGAGPNGGMAAFRAIRQGADPAHVTVVEFRGDPTRENIVSAPQDIELPVYWPFASPLYGGGQRVMQIEASYRAVLRKMRPEMFVDAFAVRACGNLLVVAKSTDAVVTPQENKRQKLIDDLKGDDTCAAFQGNDPKTKRKIKTYTDVYAVPFDVLVLANGRDGRRVMGGNPTDIYASAKAKFSTLPDKPLQAVAWTYTNTAGGIQKCPQGAPTINALALNALHLTGKPHAIATPDSCYLITDVVAGQEATLKGKVNDPAFLGQVLTALWPNRAQTDVVAIPDRGVVFPNTGTVMMTSSKYVAPTQHVTAHLVTCEGDCAIDPLYKAADNIAGAAKAIDMLGPLFRLIVEKGIAGAGVADLATQVEASRKELFKSKGLRVCQMLAQDVSTPQHAEEAKKACADAVKVAYGSEVDQTYRGLFRDPSSTTDLPLRARRSSGRTLAINRCLECHGSDNRLLEPVDWRFQVARMNADKTRVKLTETEVAAVADFLEFQTGPLHGNLYQWKDGNEVSIRTDYWTGYRLKQSLDRKQEVKGNVADAQLTVKSVNKDAWGSWLVIAQATKKVTTGMAYFDVPSGPTR